MRRSRSGRPGLVGTMARTAVIAGTATATANVVSGSMQKSAQEKAAAQEAQAVAQQAQFDASVQQAVAEQLAVQQPLPPVAQIEAVPVAPAATGGLTDDKIAQLQQLGDLYKSGILSDEEFTAMKAKILQ